MATWDDAKKRSEEQKAAGGMFLRLVDDKEKFIAAFVGDPHYYEFVWNEKLERYDPWTAEAEAAGKRKTTRFVMNVYVVRMGTGKDLKSVPPSEALKVWECNNQTFTDVTKVREKFGFDKKFVEVERNGKKGNSKTTYTVMPDIDIDAETTKVIAGLKLHDLTRVKATEDEGDASTDMGSHDKAKTNGTTASQPATHAATATAAAPPATHAAAAAATAPPPSEVIDPDTSSRLIGRLKALPRERIDEFLKKFGVAQVKMLKRTDLSAAEAFVAAHEPSAAPDPFA